MTKPLEITATKEVKLWGDSLVILLSDLKSILNLKEGDLLRLKIEKLN